MMSADTIKLRGRFTFVCYDKHGRLKWVDGIENLVVTVGKNFILDTVLAGAAYTVTGPFMGLINNVGFTGIVAGDTMSSHAGWQEGGGANAPVYGGNRKTATFSVASAGAKSTNVGVAFAFTGGGTIKGAFIVLGSGAVATKDDTNGTLFSAGLLAGGDRLVANGDTLTINYTLTLT